jgi:hypothetical protein
MVMRSFRGNCKGRKNCRKCIFKKTKLTSWKIPRESNIGSKCLENNVGDIHVCIKLVDVPRFVRKTRGVIVQFLAF